MKKHMNIWKGFIVDSYNPKLILFEADIQGGKRYECCYTFLFNDRTAISYFET